MLILLLTSLTSLVFTQDLLQMFQALDLDHDRMLNLSQWISYLSPSIHSSPACINQVLQAYDHDGNGHTSSSQFVDTVKIDIWRKLGPKQVHIGLTTEHDEMQVMWITSPEMLDTPVVEYGYLPYHLQQKSSGSWQSYDVGHIGFHGRVYRAVLKKLQGGMTYYYRVGDRQSATFSPTFKFKMPFPPGRTNHSRLIMFGDMGVVPFGFKINQDILFEVTTSQVDLVLLAGDIAYAGVSSQQKGELQPIWDLFGAMIQPWACCVPFMPGLGNHEKYYNYTSYSTRYQLPRNPGTDSNRWFYFDHNNIRIIHFSTQHPYQEGSDQYQFIEKAMAESKARWLILACHRPLLSSNSDQFNSHNPNSPLFKAMQPLIHRYHVDLVFNGHQHVYQRNDFLHTERPIAEYVDPEQPVYIVQGSAGALIRDRFQEPRPWWSKVRMGVYGYGVLEGSENRLVYEFHKMGSREVLDRWSITKTK